MNVLHVESNRIPLRELKRKMSKWMLGSSTWGETKQGKMHVHRCKNSAYGMQNLSNFENENREYLKPEEVGNSGARWITGFLTMSII
jgi:hypothetical protein